MLGTDFQFPLKLTAGSSIVTQLGGRLMNEETFNNDTKPQLLLSPYSLISLRENITIWSANIAMSAQ